jgi:phosphate transport system ATP-binding protein
MSIEPAHSAEHPSSPAAGGQADTSFASFPEASVVQLLSDDATAIDAEVFELHPAMATVTNRRIAATDNEVGWSWIVRDITAIIHGVQAPWSIIVVPDVDDFGVSVPLDEVREFRNALNGLPGVEVRYQDGEPRVPALGPDVAELDVAEPGAVEPVAVEPEVDEPEVGEPEAHEPEPSPFLAAPITQPLAAIAVAETVRHPDVLLPPPAPVAESPLEAPLQSPALVEAPNMGGLAGLDAREISAWFGPRLVLDRVSLDMAAGEVTALIGPSGCGKSTFLRILNRMHEMIPSAAMAGEVLLDGHDIYDPNRKLTDARREIGMVFQKPNPFPAMSIYDNVLASYRLTGVKASTSVKDEVVEACLSKAGLWNEVKDRLRQPGGGLSGGQQQRLCIARALAIKPRVLLMDEPCSALDPTSTRRIEETIIQLASEVTIVIVTHNMQQAARVSNQCAFFLAEQGTPGVIVEHGPTAAMFGSPQDPRTSDYVMGRFG